MTVKQTHVTIVEPSSKMSDPGYRGYRLKGEGRGVNVSRKLRYRLKFIS